MSHRQEFDGDTQERVLRRYQERAGKSATALAAEIGLSYSQYLRYVWGQTPLRLDHVPLFARAYGVAPRVLIEAILRDLPAEGSAPERYDMADDLRGWIPPAEIPAIVEQHKDKPAEAQRDIAAAYRRMASRACERDTVDPPAPQRRNTRHRSA